MLLKFQNPKFYILCKLAFFSYEMAPLWSSEINEAILEKVKVAEWDYIKCLNFLTIYTKLVPETVSYIHYAIKIYLESFVSIYQLYHLFEIIYLFTKVFYKLSITLINNWFISKTINIRADLI